MHAKLIKNLLLTFLLMDTALAARYAPSHPPCSDGSKTCISKGERIVDGFKVTKDCWEWSYTKVCPYPSKDDCKNYAHCYAVGILPCLLRDAYGNCVNVQKEFSCKSFEPVTKETQTTRYSLTEKDGIEKIVCKGMKCIDGNCVDKSYETDGEMMDSISKLYTTSKMNPDKYGNFNLFQGIQDHCSKKATGYSNCCRVSPDGWGRQVGAGCTKNEQDLMEKRSKKLCVYVGKEGKQTMGVTSVVKHHFCCFATILDKVVQIESRKQLDMNFGSGGSPNCRGLTLPEIQRLDFSKMDFTEFIEDFKVRFTGKYKTPNPREIQTKMQNSKDHNMRGYDNNYHNQGNNISGWSKNSDPKALEAESEE